MRIGIDCDGVILDYMKTVRAYAELHDMDVLQKKGLINRTAFYVRDRYDWTKEESKKFGDEFFVKLTEKAPVYALAPDMIKRLRSDGHKVFIVSNRPWISVQHTLEAEKVFAKNDLAFDGMLWTSDKISTCLENKLDVMIDDDNTIAEKCAANNIRCLFMRDKGTPKVNNPLVQEVDSWPEIYRNIKNLS